VTLAEFLGARGYATAGFVANATYCSYETGLSRGFAHYEDYDVTLPEILLCSALVQRSLNFLHSRANLAFWPADTAPLGGSRKSAARINRDFLRWVDRSRRDDPQRPFFAFLNYFDAHHPYFPPEPVSLSGPALGRSPATAAEVRMIRTWWDLDKRRLSARDVALARDAYDRCIAYLDVQLGRLFEDLQQRGLLKNTLVIVTADHGEHFGERQIFGHGCSLYMPELHVPLLVFAPEGAAAGRVVATPVSLRDIAATVADLACSATNSPFPGQSLARFWDAREARSAGRSEALLSEVDAPPEADPNHGASPACRGPLRSIVRGDWHYIRSGDGGEEMYDLAADPGELCNLAPAPGSQAMLERFRQTLRAIAP
jgi:arylsulfatase A-like enzyme